MPQVRLTNADEFTAVHGGQLPPGFRRDGDHIRNPDGRLRQHYDFSADDCTGKTVLVTGPISGSIELEDGTQYDVTPDHILVADEHVEQLNQAILREHQVAGRLAELPR